MPYQLAIIVPTLNERDNIAPLVTRLRETLGDESWQVMFVDDDSGDGTLEELRRLAEEHANISFIHRVGRRGLASACIEGMLATAAPFIAVMDADLQHDETLLPRMLHLLRNEDRDIVVGSRFAGGGSAAGLSSGRRMLASRVGNWLANRITRARLSDPLSGFFMLRRGLLDEVVHSLSGKGFKILLDIFASSRREPRLAELGFSFRARQAGDSKLDSEVIWDFAMLLADKTVGRWVPVRFVMFVAVGLSGVAVHMAVLGALLHGAGLAFVWSQAAATVTAMTSNYTLNNAVTYRDRRLTGRAFLWGLLSFYVVCAVGALITVELGELLYRNGVYWALAGFLGAAVGAVWNFGVSSVVTWRSHRSGR